MTETEWLSWDRPGDLIDCLRTFRDLGGRERKLRLYACTLFRTHEQLLRPEVLPAVELAEDFADGKAHPAELMSAVLHQYNDAPPVLRGAAVKILQRNDAGDVAWATGEYLKGILHNNKRVCPPSLQAETFREVFGNPFRTPYVPCDTCCGRGQLVEVKVPDLVALWKWSTNPVVFRKDDRHWVSCPDCEGDGRLEGIPATWKTR